MKHTVRVHYEYLEYGDLDWHTIYAYHDFSIKDVSLAIFKFQKWTERQVAKHNADLSPTSLCYDDGDRNIVAIDVDGYITYFEYPNAIKVEVSK